MAELHDPNAPGIEELLHTIIEQQTVSNILLARVYDAIMALLPENKSDILEDHHRVGGLVGSAPALDPDLTDGRRTSESPGQSLQEQ